MTHRLTACCAALAVTLGLAAPALAAADRNVDVVVVLDEAHTAGDHRANKARAAAVARDHDVVASQTDGTALFGFAASVGERRLNALANDPRVAYVDRDGEVEAFGEEAPWGVARVGLDTIERAGTNTGAGVHVYVLDTGIDAAHGDLAANVGDGYAV